MAQAKQESEEVPAGFFGGAQKWEFIQGNAEGTIGVRKPSRPNPLSWPQSPQAELKRRTHSTGRLIRAVCSCLSVVDGAVSRPPGAAARGREAPQCNGVFFG